MGTGKKVRCKSCGTEWLLLDGVGFVTGNNPDPELSNKSNKDDLLVCPQCGSTEIEDTDIDILWD